MSNHNGFSVQWLGDIALTAQFIEPENHEAIRRNVEYLCASLPPADLRVANWEAPLLGAEGINPLKKVTLHTTEEAAGNIQDLGLDIALVANNHVFDCMRSGFEKTISFLDTLGIRCVGAGLSEADAKRPLLLDIHDQPLAVLAYVDADTNPRIPPDRSLHVNWLDRCRVLNDVRTLREDGRLVLVSFHCGMDFVALPSPRHRTLARETIEAGAALVMCCHPHRIQAYEPWKDGYIFYGLGNLIAGAIYPWPSLAEPTVAVTCRIQNGMVSPPDIRHFVFRNGLLGPDRGERGPKVYRKANRKLAGSDEVYARHFARALAYEVSIIRPIHFLRRHKNPLSLLASFEKRHAVEYYLQLKRIFAKSDR